MDEKKNEGISLSSLVDLKAELFRKQEELRQQKLAGKDGNYIKGISVKKTKPNIWSKKNAGVLERAQRDVEQKEEDENIFEKSKKALAEKAKLYDKICKSSDIPDEDGSGTYLVDFQKKVIDNIVEKRRKEETKSEEKLEELPPEDNLPTEEQWVDYVDSLGRSRRCLRKDLAELQRRDKELNIPKREAVVSTSSDNTDTTEKKPTLTSTDVSRELLREKWEKEEEEAKNQPIHYTNVRFDEIRNHGVGYYEFSKSEEARQKEMETLQKLREQTIDERSRRERLKEKRKAMLDARLAKVKQRRTMKEGLLGLESDKADDNKLDDDIGPRLEEMTGQAEAKEKKEVEPLIRDDSWRKDFPVREWDKGKEKMAVFSPEKYSEDRRNERVDEFAPPSFYKENKAGRNPIKHSDSRANEGVKHDSTITKTTTTTTTGDENKEKDLNIESQPINVADIPLPPTTSEIQNSNSEIVNTQTNSQVPSQLPYQHDTYNNIYTNYYGNIPSQWMAPSSQVQTHHHPPLTPGGSSLPPNSSMYFNQQMYQGFESLSKNVQANYNHPFSSIETSGVTNLSSELKRKDGKSIQPPKISSEDLRCTQNETQNENISDKETKLNSKYQLETYGPLHYNGPEPTGDPRSTAKTSSANPQRVHKTEHPKINIVDSRFIQNEETSTEVADITPIVEAVPYEPGSLTDSVCVDTSLSKQIEQQRTQSNYKGGAVTYKTEEYYSTAEKNK